MPNKITVDWNSQGMEWEDLTASLSALMEYENAPVTQISLAVKGKPTLAALKTMLEAAQGSGAECKMKLVATFDDSKQLRLFGPEAADALATVTEIDDFLKGKSEDKPEY